MRIQVQIQPMNDPIDETEFHAMVRDVNREQNMIYLRANAPRGGIQMITHTTGVQHVYIPGYSLSFAVQLLFEFPMRFRQIFDILLMRSAQSRSQSFEQPKAVKPVSQDHGRQFMMTPKLLARINNPPSCSICLDPLIPEGMKRKKVWELECGCYYHAACVRKWWREDSRCPNCREDCA